MKEIVIDLLGSDYGYEELLSGVTQASKKYPTYCFVCAGPKEKIEGVFQKENINHDSIKILDTNKVITNNDNPMLIARGEFLDTSLLMCISYLKENKDAIGLITAGSTGATLVGSRFKLGLIENIQTPALGALLKHYNGKDFLLLDCGANLAFNADKYVEFAHIGDAFMKAYMKVGSPRVSLLNVGKEEHKGSEQLKNAYATLKEKDINFIGNIEGNDVFLDKADVIVSDGFTGNVILKNAESVGLICSNLAKDSNKELSNKINSLFNYTALGGALVLGTKKIIYKAHGSSKASSIIPICNDLISLDKNSYIDIITKEFSK